MDVESFRSNCLARKGVTESFPFDDKTLVFKVMGKMFALLSLDAEPPTANLKCEPLKAEELREQYPDEVLPGYHMNKRHWNTVVLEGGLPDSLLRELIDHSYELVVAGLPKKIRAEWERL
ncbi:MAG: MmcQ/YjbR family DNA-binding protein [Bacteroidetes bacterium]|nr:MAG: MmcQ/YjbR family DNA-binding protein [Bacteroidota bacterium]